VAGQGQDRLGALLAAVVEDLGRGRGPHHRTRAGDAAGRDVDQRAHRAAVELDALEAGAGVATPGVEVGAERRIVGQHLDQARLGAGVAGQPEDRLGALPTAEVEARRAARARSGRRGLGGDLDHGAVGGAVGLEGHQGGAGAPAPAPHVGREGVVIGEHLEEAARGGELLGGAGGAQHRLGTGQAATVDGRGWGHGSSD
jgi:hypothetical protein